VPETATDLIDNAEQIASQALEEWTDLAEREPWLRIPPRLSMDHLPELIRALATTALVTFFARAQRDELADCAVRHGEHRFQAGIAEEVLIREYELLRWALWGRLKQRWPLATASEAIILLDSALTFAHGATLRGYHRRVIEEMNDWPAALERYTEEWSFPSR
jgi:hypothetical protein